MLGHLVELVEIAVGVGVAEARTDGVVDKHDVGELIPRAIVVDQRVLVLEPVGPNFHQGAILGAAPRAAVEPDDRPLPVGDVFVLEVPEEEVTVCFGGDFDVAMRQDTSA